MWHEVLSQSVKLKSPKNASGLVVYFWKDKTVGHQRSLRVSAERGHRSWLVGWFACCQSHVVRAASKGMANLKRWSAHRILPWELEMPKSVLVCHLVFGCGVRVCCKMAWHGMALSTQAR